MHFTKYIATFLFSLVVLCSCVRESDEPPGCTTPDMPGFKYTRTEVTAGEQIKLEGVEPAGETNGAFEWQGPNKYFLTQKQLTIANAKEANEGEYKLYYLNGGRCRSKPATIYVTVYSFPETCGLYKNTVRNEDELLDRKMKQVQEDKDSAGRYIITGNNDSLQIKIIFPTQQRPMQSRTYSIAQNSGSVLAENELDILILYNGKWYRAIPKADKNVNLLLNNTGLHLAFCSHTFLDDNNNQLIFSGHIAIL
jgi:hypothetical protein